MTATRARTAASATPGRRRTGARLAMLAVPAGMALAAAVIAAGPANALDGAGYTGPIFAYGGLCLDVQGANTANFTPVQVYGCNSTDAQQWTLGTDYTIRALGKCLDVQYGGTAAGTPVELYDCNGTGSQVWLPQGDGSFRNPQSDKCLEDTGSSASGGTQAEIWECDGNSSELFTY